VPTPEPLDLAGYAVDHRGIGLVLDARHRAEEWVRQLATRAGWRMLFLCHSAAEAIEALRGDPPALLLVDLELAHGAAFEVLREAGRLWPECVAVALSVSGQLPLLGPLGAVAGTSAAAPAAATAALAGLPIAPLPGLGVPSP
jgi:hypothetical protein